MVEGNCYGGEQSVWLCVFCEAVTIRRIIIYFDYI